MSAAIPTEEMPVLIGIERLAVTRCRASAAANPNTSPCAPMAWARGRLLPLSVLPWWQRLAYRILRLPPLVRVEPEGEERVADIRGLHYTRARAAALACDGEDYLFGIEFEADYGSSPRKTSTFSRPRHPAYEERERADAGVYTGDLRECVEMTLAAENTRLRRAVTGFVGLGDRADRLDRRIDRLL